MKPVANRRRLLQKSRSAPNSLVVNSTNSSTIIDYFPECCPVKIVDAHLLTTSKIDQSINIDVDVSDLGRKLRPGDAIGIRCPNDSCINILYLI